MTDDAPVTRRAVLSRLALGSLVATGAVASSGPFLRTMGRWNQRVESGLFSLERSAPELPPESETARADFPSYFISPEVPLAPASWRLAVGGMVARPASLSLADLQRLPRTAMRVRHHCVEGWSAVAAWHGVRLSDVAALVGADPDAGFVEFRSFDAGYWSSWDRASAFHPQNHPGVRHERRRARTGARRPAPSLFGDEARLQDGEVPHRGQLPARTDRRLLGRSGLRMVRGGLTRRRVDTIVSRRSVATSRVSRCLITEGARSTTLRPVPPTTTTRRAERGSRRSRLMLAAQGGDRTAYRELLDDIVGDLRAYLRRTMSDGDDGEDALQDTLLALHRYRHTYSPGRPFEPWLFAIARNVARDHLQKRRQRRDRERHPEFLPEQTVDLDEGVERRLHEGIAALSPAQREALMMVKINGYSVAEAARQTGTTPGALKLRIHRAYLALKQRLES